jgi:L-ribulokinase
MSRVLGVDFGTLNVRASIFDDARGRLGSGVANYPLRRSKSDPNFATQSHADHLHALIEANGSSIVVVDEHLQPLDDDYPWRDAAEITEGPPRDRAWRAIRRLPCTGK